MRINFAGQRLTEVGDYTADGQNAVLIATETSEPINIVRVFRSINRSRMIDRLYDFPFNRRGRSIDKTDVDNNLMRLFLNIRPINGNNIYTRQTIKHAD